MIFVNGKVIGFDVVSLSSAYEQVHTQLVESYVIGAAADADQRAEPTAVAANEFLSRTIECAEARHNAVSQGSDYRYRSADITGSVLVAGDSVVHMAFLSRDEPKRERRRESDDESSGGGLFGWFRRG